MFPGHLVQKPVMKKDTFQVLCFTMSFQFQLYDKTENWFAIAEKNGFDSLSLGQLMRGGNIMKKYKSF